jgi:DNA-binding GntR family transcriptional regulator
VTALVAALVDKSLEIT